jgi:hypothetical protein
MNLLRRWHWREEGEARIVPDAAWRGLIRDSPSMRTVPIETRRGGNVQ